MKHALELEIQSQPNDSSCGPTCLAAVYRYWEDPVDLPLLISQVGQLVSGGTLAVQLGCHALLLFVQFLLQFTIGGHDHCERQLPQFIERPRNS